MNHTRRFRVSGVVQGVWYRKFVFDTAIGLGINGWVRNTKDGGVETIVIATEQQLDQFESALWVGSPASDVQDVQIEAAELQDPGDFQILW